MKRISLTKNQYAIVDNDDYEWLSKFNWCFTAGRSSYAVRQIGTNKKSKHLSMHRAITKAPEGSYVDHINGNTLDNRKCNLRLCTNRENLINSKLRSDNTSGYRGVHWSKQKSKWQATIHNKGHLYHLGFYDDKRKAAIVYDEAALKMFGEFARFNLLKRKGSSAEAAP